jgi:uncharacterized radical SAM superfamily protein
MANKGAANMRPQVDPIKKQVDILLSNAKMGVSPETMADTVVNMTPDEKLDELKAFVSDPHVLERMIKSNPEVRAYHQWFQTLRENVIRLLAEIETDNNAASDATGTNANDLAVSPSPGDPPAQ